jgi:hypothetical protein
MMEMLVDPALRLWVPSWVREQYERRNPFFRRALEDVMDVPGDDGLDARRRRREFEQFCNQRRGLLPLTAVSSNKTLLRRTRDYMRWLEKLEARRVAAAEEVEGGVENDALEGGIGSGEGSDQESRVDENSGAEEDIAEEMLREPLPDCDVDGNVGEGGGWEQATSLERLSAAGPAPNHHPPHY